MSAPEHSPVELEDKAGAANADAAPAASPSDRDRDADAAAAREARPLGEGKHDHLAAKDKATEGDRQDALLDEGVEETFPASDPVSVKRIT